jgi:serine/threonine-protein kinase HipA
MLIMDRNNKSRLLSCIEAAKNFHLSEADAIGIIEGQIKCILKNWEAVCKDADLSEVDKRLLWRRQIFNPYAFEGLEVKAPGLIKLLPG